MKAYHFLRENMRAGSGREKPWQVGEERTLEGRIAMCERGYHWGKTWYAALPYAPGPVACVVDVDKAAPDSAGKGVSRRRKLIAALNVERELRIFTCLCTERVLNRERKAGREPDERSWHVVRVARDFANGKATKAELTAAGTGYCAAVEAAYWTAAKTAARTAYWAAAAGAVRAAARTAADAADWASAEAAERQWQRRTLTRLLNKALREVESPTQ